MSPYPADDLRQLTRKPEPAWLWDPDRCRIVWANRAGLAFWREATLIDLIERRFDPEMSAMRRIMALAATLAAGESANETFIFHPRDGDRTVRAVCRTQPLDDGRTGVLMVASLAEPEPAGEGARAGIIEGAIDSLPLAIAVFDGHGSLVFANAACRDMAAGEPAAGTGVLAGWLGDEGRAADLVGRALTLGSVSEVESVRTRFGTRAHRIHMIRFAAPIHGRTALLVALEDIEDRRRIERARDRQADETEMYLAAAADLTFALDERLRLTAISDNGAGLFDADVDRLIGRSWDEVTRVLGLEIGAEAAAALAAFEPLRGALARVADASAVLSVLPVAGAGRRPAGLRGTLTRIAAPLGFAGAAPEREAAPDLSPPAAEGGAVRDRTGEAEGPRDNGQPANDQGDEETFSAIARAIAAHAGAAAGAERAPQSDGGAERVVAPLRVVGGVDHPRGAASRAPAVPPAPRPVDSASLRELGEPALVHKAFEIVAANRALARLLGHADSREMLAETNLLNIFPDERARLFGLQSRIDDGDALHPGEIGIIPLRAVTAGRGSRLLLANVERVTFNGDGAVLMRFEDPAASKAATEPAVELGAAGRRDELSEVQAREAELRAILNSAADGIVTLDAEGRIATFNATAETIFGYAATEVAGKRLSSILDPASGRVVDAYLQSVSERGLPGLHREGREVGGVRKDGAAVPLYLTIGRIKLEQGPKFCAVIRDITQWAQSVAELRREKEAAEHASSKKSDFLARISHELRTPLNAIIGFSEVMSEEKFGPIANDRYKGYLTDIRSSGEHLLSLINDLLDLSKIEAGKLELNFSSVDLSALVQQCVSLMQPQATRERVIMRTSLPDQLPSVVADERSIRQILLNILSNAIKFTPPGGQVILSALLDDAGRVQIRIRDTGAGMSGEELARAMEPFRQVDAAMRTTAQAGTGLGLPLTKALTEANRAEFRIESTPQAGTLVQITFPSERVLAG